uniref:Structural maintenance of chromosomes protein 5 n=1 Tax=Meloidogyne floridensis TaxID=298350 RepID=A0A915NY18_9BILA
IEVFSSRHNPKKIYVERKPIIYNNPRFDMEHTKSLIDVDNELKTLQKDKEILKERQENVAKAKEDFKRRGEEYREKMRKEKEKSDEIKRYRDHATKCKEKLSQYSKEKPNLEAAQAAYNEASNKILETAIGDFEKIVDSMENQRDPINTIAINCDEHVRLKSRLKQLKAEKDFFDQIHQANKEDFQQKLKSRVEAKEEVEYRKSVFKQVAECSPPGSGGEVTNDDKRKFEKILKEFEEKQIPDDLESIELKNAEERKKSSKDRQDGTEKDADEYEKFLKEREILVKNIRLATEKNDRWKNKMDTELASWLEQLRPMIDSINEKFSQFFATLGCVGEVRFDEPENKYSISEYGIKIMVKFRNGTCLRELNPQTQSGGERSVSTMLYIMALQNLCFVPFRCVDEINQGMDPNNERAVFNMMVKLLDNNEGEGGGNNNNKTQYFLLTPKLLNGLQFNERVTVHVVHNGPAIENPLDWDPQRLLRR